MPPIVLTDPASGSTAEISVELGFNCFAFRAVVDGRTIDVIDADPDFPQSGRPSGHGIPLLFPYPNRIRDGRYSWNGRDYRIPDSVAAFDDSGNAIHGFCLDRPWRLIDRDESSVTAAFQLSVDAPDRRELWPADALIEVRYRLAGSALTAVIRIVNPDSDPLPWGFGTHPYFRLPLSENSDLGQCLVHAPASIAWNLSDCLPTGRQAPVTGSADLRDGARADQLALDDVLTGIEGLSDEPWSCGIIDEVAGLEVVQSCENPLVFRELVAYTPPGRAAVCLEPYTCVTDAVNLQSTGVDAGWRSLDPGAEFRTWISIEARRVVV